MAVTVGFGSYNLLTDIRLACQPEYARTDNTKIGF